MAFRSELSNGSGSLRQRWTRQHRWNRGMPGHMWVRLPRPICVRLALRHLDKCLELMLKTWDDWTAEQKTAFCEYRRLYHATTKDLRDALEHEEDRFSGGHDGPHSNKAYEGNDFSPPAIQTKRPERLIRIYVLDQWYDIGEAAEAATKLHDTLIDVCDRLSLRLRHRRLAARAPAILTARHYL